MIISHSYKFVFVHIHKCAGESVTWALAPHLKDGDILCGVTKEGKKNDKRYNIKYGINKHSHGKDIREHLGADKWDEYYKFCIVRNPYLRILSLYTFVGMLIQQPWRKFFKICGIKYRCEVWDWPATKNYLSSKNFSEFIRNPLFDQDRAARPMLDWITDETGVIIDNVGKVENLAEDMQEIGKTIGIENLKIPNKNQSMAGNLQISNFYESKEDYNLIYEIYKKDFEYFGYERI